MVLLTLAANFPMVSTTPAVPVAKFAVGVVDTGGAPSLANISAKKNQNDSYCYFRGLERRSFLKKAEAKNLMTLSLYERCAKAGAELSKAWRHC